MKYFTEDELKCTHCGKSGMDKDFMVRIEALREQLGFPFPVNSAYRCPEHPIEARKSSPGAHSTGHAIDIGVQGEKAHMLLDAALQAGFTGIGVSQKGSLGRFIHLDDLEGSSARPRPTVWSY
jgi:zinc D-Ala-D-Ala carboxypeptidase